MRKSIADRAASARAIEAGAYFGLHLDRPSSDGAFLLGMKRLAQQIRPELTPGRIVMLTGPSGCGKSTLLRLLNPARRGTPRRSADVLPVELDPTRDAQRALIDLLPLDVPASIRLLTLVGLGEPALLLRPLSRLSEGQQHRVRLALTLATLWKTSPPTSRDRGGAHPSENPHPSLPGRTRRRRIVVIDEFGSTLDRLGAKLLAESVRRFVTRSVEPGRGSTGLAVLVATAHDDVVEHLSPDVLITLSARGPESATWRPLDAHAASPAEDAP